MKKNKTFAANIQHGKSRSNTEVSEDGSASDESSDDLASKSSADSSLLVVPAYGG